MTAAARTRRYRQRQRAGVRILQIEIDDALVDALIGARFLHRDDADNPEAVKASLERVHDFLKRRAAEV